MASESPHVPPLILFYYPSSIFGRKLLSYLLLRQIPFTTCEQPRIMPRPDLASIGVTYRRIPVLAIGKDIYCDVNFIISKLDQLYPYHHNPTNPSSAAAAAAAAAVDLRPTSPNDLALTDLLSHQADTASPKALSTLPATLDTIFQDAAFVADRTSFFGRPFTAAAVTQGRAEGLAAIRSHFAWLETHLLSDGRRWLLSDTESPTLADLHVARVYVWLGRIPGALEGDLTREGGGFPRVWAWLDRYEALIAKVTRRADMPNVEGRVARETILAAGFAEGDVVVDGDEAAKLGLREGDVVEGWPVDTGFTHRDRGVLVGLSARETVIQTPVGTRIHHPRLRFAVEKVQASDDNV